MYGPESPKAKENGLICASPHRHSRVGMDLSQAYSPLCGDVPVGSDMITDRAVDCRISTNWKPRRTRCCAAGNFNCACIISREVRLRLTQKVESRMVGVCLTQLAHLLDPCQDMLPLFYIVGFRPPTHVAWITSPRQAVGYQDRKPTAVGLMSLEALPSHDRSLILQSLTPIQTASMRCPGTVFPS